VRKPEQVKVLFLAESAPGTSEGYFYEPEYREGYKGILRTHLFKLLEIDGNDIDLALAEFKRRGYFLSDAVKCRCDKGERPQVPTSLAKNCGRNWLGRELDILDPERVCALGNASLKALSTIQGYKVLSGVTAGHDCGKIVEAKRPVLVWVFPSDRTSIYSDGKEEEFLRFAQG